MTICDYYELDSMGHACVTCRRTKENHIDIGDNKYLVSHIAPLISDNIYKIINAALAVVNDVKIIKTFDSIEGHPALYDLADALRLAGVYNEKSK